eukprot:scaffold807_cov67-Phaeocystis_antarctica.AAC.4
MESVAVHARLASPGEKEDHVQSDCRYTGSTNSSIAIMPNPSTASRASARSSFASTKSMEWNISRRSACGHTLLSLRPHVKLLARSTCDERPVRRPRTSASCDRNDPLKGPRTMARLTSRDWKTSATVSSAEGRPTLSSLGRILGRPGNRRLEPQRHVRRGTPHIAYAARCQSSR